MAEFPTPERVGALAAFLCSDEAKTIIGVPFSVGGKRVAQQPGLCRGSIASCSFAESERLRFLSRKELR